MVRLGRVIESIQHSRRIASIRLEARHATHSWRYWQSGDRRRLEAYPEASTTISRGEVSWRYSADQGTSEYHGTDMSYWPIESILDLTGILSSDLELTGEDHIAGRHVALLVAKPRARWTYRSFMSTEDGSPMEVAVDIERGVALRTRWVEVTRIAFDETFDKALFEPRQASPAAPVRLEPRQARILSQAEAIAQSSFPLMEPSLLPQGTRLLTWMKWESRTASWVGAIYLVEPGPYHTITLHLARTPRHRGDERWEEVDVGGAVVQVRRNGSELSVGRAAARVVRDGVVAMLDSTLPTDVLARIAASVRPL